ncbi:MAG: helix-turn-helix transcriptional regulator [Clostridia bacterium]|nr:helix-turn-helix transcriptional regulator [Clostridia bacterium]
MNTYSLVKERLLDLLEKRHMSIYALSMRSGVSPSTVKNILYGKSKNPGIVTIKMLCDGLGMSLYDFFDTEEFRSAELELI